MSSSEPRKKTLLKGIGKGLGLVNNLMCVECKVVPVACVNVLLVGFVSLLSRLTCGAADLV